jgi:hypothetical protein
MRPDQRPAFLAAVERGREFDLRNDAAAIALGEVDVGQTMP